MKQKNFILFIAFWLTTSFLLSQDTTSQETENNKVRKYIDFILHQTGKSQNYWFTCNYQYSFSPIGKTLGVNGTILNGGINLARLFSRKIILGVCFDVKLLNGLSHPKRSSEFVSDFNDSFIDKYDNATDSVNAHVVKAAINNGPGQYFVGNQLFNIGLMFSLFPQRYGGVLIQVKKGSSDFAIDGIHGNKYINNGTKDYEPIIFKGNWYVELTIKPVAFFRNTYVMKGDDFRKESFANRILVSFYYEKFNFQSGEFNGTPISKMVTNDFISKYSIDNRFGFKIGIGLY